jgi:hypothetical protein
MDTLMEILFEYIASSLLLNKLMNYGVRIDGVRIVRKFAVIHFFFGGGGGGGGKKDPETIYNLCLILKTM